jgi:single-strand DNA-binding protein
MATSLNKVELIGRLGADPEVKNLTNGGAVANLRLATSDQWKDRDGEKQEKTEWHSISIWNEKTIEFVEKWLKKGDLVRIEGKIQTRKWTDQDGKERYSTEIHIPKFASLDALMKLSFDNDNNGGGGGGRSSGRSSRDDDRGSSDDRGSRSSGRSSSRSRDDDRGDRGGDRNDDRGGSRSSSRSSSRDDRNDDRGGNGGGRSSNRAPSRNNDMDDDIPF